MRDEQTPPKPPYKVKEYAAQARVTPNAVYEMVRRGELLRGAGIRPCKSHPT